MSPKRTWLAIAITLILLAVILYAAQNQRFKGASAIKTTAPEIENIKKLKNTTAQGEELKKLLDRVGPIEAQEQMLASGLPFTGETHLLIHVVGDYIYNK